MPLLGTAAIVIWTEIDSAALAEHDAWHSTEHFPERLAIAGFRRGRRYAAADPQDPKRRFILYELADIAVSTSAPYLERLNNPTPWSRRIMGLSRLTRTLCRVAASFGAEMGNAALAIRLSPLPGQEPALQAWLVGTALPAIARKPRIAGAHLLQKDASVVRPQTNEEKLRKGGSDASVDWVIAVEADDMDCVRDLLPERELRAHGAAEGSLAACYTLSQAMTAKAPQ